MTKTLTEAHITTAKARSRLEFGVHWRRLDADAHLGYRKGKRSGVWFVRWRNRHDGSNYKQAPVGVANDFNDKPAEGTLTFEQAMTQAREHVTRSRTEAAAQAAGCRQECGGNWRSAGSENLNIACQAARSIG